MADKKKETLRDMIGRLLEKSRELRAEGARLRRKSERLEELVNCAQRVHSERSARRDESEH